MRDLFVRSLAGFCPKTLVGWWAVDASLRRTTKVTASDIDHATSDSSVPRSQALDGAQALIHWTEMP